MAYSRIFRRPAVSDPALARTFQQIEDEFSNILKYVGHRALVVTKADTGDPASATEGDICINTFDNTIKQYADGAWRTLATW